MTVAGGAWPDRRVLVTGASSGIGAALARRLAGRGATVGLVARREDRLAEVLADCRSHAPASRMWVADLGDLELAERVALEAWDAFGGLDVVVNNAAIPAVRAVPALTPDYLERAVRVDFLSPARICLAVVPRMLDAGGGTIVNVSSLGGRLGILHEAAYCAAKFALSGFTESLALDLWDTPVTVRLITPGPVDTEIWDRPDSDPSAYVDEKVPADDVAAGIVDAVDSDRFEHFLPDLSRVVQFKAGDVDAYLARSHALGREALASRDEHP